MPDLNLGPQFRCGYLTVPENRSKPNGRTVKVAVAIAKASSPAPKTDPVLYLAGGPGGTAIVTATQHVAAGINADRDAIFMDQRGTYHSQPFLACPEIDAFANVLPTRSFFASDTKSADQTAVRACRDRLTAAGNDLSAYNTYENAADVADLRLALGIPTWNIYGVSYGTYLTLTVLREHPQGVRSVVLDSVVPPQANLQEGFWTWPRLGYTALFQACAAQPGCAAAYPDLERELIETVNRLQANPQTVSVTTPAGDKKVVIDGYWLANALVVPSLAPGVMAELPKRLHAAAGGDVSGIAEIIAAEGPSGVVGWGLSLGVFCGEQVAWTTSAAALAAAKTAFPQFPDPVLTPRVAQAPTLAYDCETWEMPKVNPDPHRTVTSDIPALIMDGTLDAVTPPANGAEVAIGLSRSQVVHVPGAAHDVLLWDQKCSQPLMNAFLLDPAAPVDKRCVETLRDPQFTLP